MSDYPSTPFKRSSRIARTGLKVGTNYAMHHFKRMVGGENPERTRKLHHSNARLLFDEFSKLKGTALKLAQTLSLDHGMLPGEFAEVMAQAQYSVPPIGRSLVRQIIKKELGAWPEELFDRFEPEAFAAASIGQVHRARLADGTNVVVKVQYPDVRSSIRSDLQMARLVFNRLVRSENTDDYFAEVHDKMMEETDYTHEAAMIEAFHARYNGSAFCLPRVLSTYSTDKVLVMSALEGEHIADFLKRNPTQKERNLYGQRLWDFFHAQINDWNTLHADSHPGNYMLCRDGRLGVLDMGCVKECPDDFFVDYVFLLPLQLRADDQELWPVYERLGLVYSQAKDSDDEREFFELCKQFGELVVSPYRKERFDFADAQYAADYARLVKQAASRPEPRGSHHFIYITRSHIGLYRMLMQLGAEIETERGRDHVMGWCDKKMAATQLRSNTHAVAATA